jgi:hypothetical protein
MLARHAVLLTPSKSSGPPQLPSCKQIAPLTPLAATLMDFPASVANKRLMTRLSPLAATLTRNRGAALPGFDIPTFRRSFNLSPFLSCFYTLFCATGHLQLLWNQFVANSFHREGGCTPCSRILSRPDSPLAAGEGRGRQGCRRYREIEEYGDAGATGGQEKASGAKAPELQGSGVPAELWVGGGAFADGFLG